MLNYSEINSPVMSVTADSWSLLRQTLWNIWPTIRNFRLINVLPLNFGCINYVYNGIRLFDCYAK